MGKRFTHRKWLLAAASFSVAVLLVEFSLRVFTIFPVHGELSNRVPDDVLGYRMDPALDDIDDNGFRNDAVPEHADIVTIGDSHTYGNNVASESSWPRRLGAMAGMTVYNLGVGGYGPLQYHHLMKRAIALGPKHIVVGLYFANDLYDTCASIRENVHWRTWARERGYDAAKCLSAPPADADRPRRLSARSLFTSTAIGSFFTHAVERASERRLIEARAATRETRLPADGAVVVSDGRNETLITHGRLATQARYMDLREDDVATAFLITKDVIGDARTIAAANAITLSVLVVPSKASVFHEYLLARGDALPQDYGSLVENEEQLVTALLTFCDGIALRCAVAKPYLMRELGNTTPVYPPTGDGHPLETGYLAYATAAFDGIRATPEIAEAPTVPPAQPPTPRRPDVDK